MGAWDLDAKHLDDALTVLQLRGSGDAHISADGEWIVINDVGDVYPYVHLYKARNDTFEQVAEFESHGNSCIGFTSNGRWLVSWDSSAGTPGRSCWIRRLDERSNLKMAYLSGHEGGVGRVVFGRTGRWIATVSKGGVVRIWDLASDNPALSGVRLGEHQIAEDYYFSHNDQFAGNR